MSNESTIKDNSAKITSAEGVGNLIKLPIDAEILPAHDDKIFKSIMTHPDTKPALMDLVSACIGRVVTEIQIHNNELPITDIDEKSERFDVNCTIDDGTQVEVEMQSSRMVETKGSHSNFFNRSIYYLADLHSSQKSKGVNFMDMAATYQITFSMYTVLPHRTDYITKSNMRTEDGEIISSQLNMIVVELSKLEDILKKPVDEMSSMEMWSVFLGHADNPKYRALINDMIEKKEVLSMASAVLTTISKDEDEKAKFRARKKFEMDMTSNMITAERIGVEEGRRIERAEVALKLLRRNRPIEEIVEDTGLTRQEIEGLRNS